MSFLYPLNMRILFIADGRSPIAINWIEYFTHLEDHETHLVSTFHCQPALRLASLQIVPVAFSGLKDKSHQRLNENGFNQEPSRVKSVTQTLAMPGVPTVIAQKKGIWGANMVGVRTSLRQWLGPLTLSKAARKLVAAVQELKPDIIHAMRIPYEGMLVALAKEQLGSSCPPVVLSVWGNDFTLHARSTPWMAALTRQALSNTDAIHTDCYRDVRLAQEWGFSQDRPVVVLPGAGGIQKDLFHPPKDEEYRHAPVIINPRGFRAYVQNDTFFKAIPLVLAQKPEARFLCTSMEGEAQPRSWVHKYGIQGAVDLLPKVSRNEMADLFRLCQVAVSPTTHDGTPNTLLEAMACGCFPVAGDLESIREWITSGQNGLLVDPTDPTALAGAILQALGDNALRAKAAAINISLVLEKAEYHLVMEQARNFYARFV